MKGERMKNGSSVFLRSISGLYLFNAVGTTIMYVKTLSASAPSTFDPLTLRAYAIADFPFSILPGFVVVYGLLRMRFWSWPLALMLNAVYFHSMTVILTENVLKGDQSPLSAPMTPVSVYFLAFAIVSTVYLVRERLG